MPSDYEQWKAATIKKLRYPKAEQVRERVWKHAFIKNLTPEAAATEIDAHWYNGLSPAERKRLNLAGK